jgi:hypothetical protein
MVVDSFENEGLRLLLDEKIVYARAVFRLRAFSFEAAVL